MEIPFAELAQLGGTTVTVALFIGYLVHKNGKTEKAHQRNIEALDRIHKGQEVHTRVLMRLARQHGLQSDADDLMEGV